MGRHLGAFHQLSLLFISWNWNGKLSAWVGLKTQSASCSTASNFGRPLASLWQITNQSAIFHSCLVSVLLCSHVITAYSISQYPVNDLSALWMQRSLLHLMSWAQAWAPCMWLSLARARAETSLLPPCGRQIAKVRIVAKRLRIPPRKLNCSPS